LRLLTGWCASTVSLRAELHGSPLSYFSSFVLFCRLTFWFHSLPLCLWLPFPPLFFPVAASDLSAPKKCRARFGLDQQNNWCGPCRCVWCVHKPGPGEGWVIRPLGPPPPPPPPPHSVTAFPPPYTPSPLSLSQHQQVLYAHLSVSSGPAASPI